MGWEVVYHPRVVRS